jgi:hypothetical protein
MSRLIRFFFAFMLTPLFLIGEISPFVLITIPKAGSHLCIKALHFMTGSAAIWHTYFPSSYYIPPNLGFLYTHFCLTSELEQHYQALPQLKKIIVIRDLRDVAVSMVKQICKAPWPGMTSQQRENFKNLSFDKQLLFVINYEYDAHKIAKDAPNSNQVALIRVAEQAASYASDPTNLVIRYENMVGQEGGGTFASQVEELRKISTFLGANLFEGQLRQIANQLYGNTYNPFGKEEFFNYRSTFSKGQIGSWKETFQEEHKAAFKAKIGKYLIDLGYELDFNW